MNAENRNIAESEMLAAPETVRMELPLPDPVRRQIRLWRRQIIDILDGHDQRLLLIVGPCSIHHPEAALEYALRLEQLSRQVASSMLVVMRAYFEKPRTTLGWKGLIYDPDLNGEYNIEKGILTARSLLLKIAAMGLPVASEVLDPVMSAYFTDAISWAGIGARTTESPTHRQLASGLPTPVGFKNGTDGSLKTALEALTTVVAPHSFIGVMRNGHTGIFRTKGNPFCHLVLRGGINGPNYSPEHLADARQKLADAGLRQRILVDCSHGNSSKNIQIQKTVFEFLIKQYCIGTDSLAGVMLESYLKAGNQQLLDKRPVLPDISITDPCLGWEESQEIILDADQKIHLAARNILRY
ncbi:MAG: 3-deoxy-7-phosphoheptulonate synthase [Oligosphaeraceae bacterium]|nr:3-deoxy-7-phosphoheptulonate synthase [Oligosphaeraceae bacterium]